MFSLFSRQNWKQNKQFSIYLKEKPIIIGNDCIWLSANDNQKSEKGMIQYNPKTDKIEHIIKYPSNIKPSRHCCSEYNRKIYI